MEKSHENNKFEKIFRQVSQKLLDGAYGKSGDRFISVRELAEMNDISLVTAQRIVDKLREERLIYLCSHAYYITVGRIGEDSALSKAIEKRTGNSHEASLIGIHFPKINNEFFSALLKEVVQSVRAAGFMPLVMFSEGKPELEKEILHRFVGLGVKAIITCPNDGISLKNIYNRYPLPIVYLAKRSSFYDSNYVAVDENTSAGHVAKHFVNMGYENFMYVGFEQDVDKDYRMDSFMRKLERLGRTIPPENIILLKETDKFAVSGYVSSIIANANKPLGVFCFHDLLAIELLIAVKKRKLKVPEDVGIVGFDNLDIAAKHSPALSTVGYRFDTMASSAVKMLTEIIAEKDNIPKQPILVRHALYIRESSRKGV